jgi:hypothetical protein
MIRASVVILTAVALCQTASAQDCPPGAATQATIPDGASFRVLSLHPEDAYYSSSYAQIVGMDGTSTAELTNNGGCWYGGPANSDGGDSYYFYKVAVALDITGGGKTALTPANTTCPSDAIRNAPNTTDTYTVLGLHPDDAYSGGGTVSTGETVTFGGDTNLRDGCWISGPATTSSGSELYFFKVAVSAGGGAIGGGSSGGRVIASCPANATTRPIASGAQVRFLGIHADDAYANGVGTFAIGDVMTTTGTLNLNNDCWYGGPTTSTDGSTQYFYKAAFELVGSGGGGGTKDAEPSRPSLADQLRVLAPDDSLDSNVALLLVSNFDRNNSGSIDTLNEVNRLPCDVLTALDVPYQARWGTSVRTALGFRSDLIWVGSSIGFNEMMRSPADRQFARCGIQ